MVLTITVVGNGQGTGNGSGHAVLSPNDLAQLMSGQTVTGLLNPDGSITLNSNVLQSQQIPNTPSEIANGSNAPVSHSNQAPSHYQLSNNSLPQISPINIDSNSLTTTTTSNSTPTPTYGATVNSNEQPQNVSNQGNTTQKKTGQKRLSAKQKQQQQQQQQQHLQQQQQAQIQKFNSNQQDIKPIITNTHTDCPTSEQASYNQEPQIVATVQLPNGQIGQLIAPSGAQFWSPNAINLQQLSMAVAAATNPMPQPMSIPTSSPSQTNQPLESPGSSQTPCQPPSMRPVGMQPMVQHNGSQHQSQPLDNSDTHDQHQHQQPQQQQQQHILVQLPGNQVGQILARPGLNQLWSGGPISLTQLSALAQQGVVQVAPMSGVSTSAPANGQRAMEMIPQTAMQGLITQNNSQPIHTLPLSNGGQFITQDPNDPNKWQLIQQAQFSTQQHQSLPSDANNNNETNSGNTNRSNDTEQNSTVMPARNESASFGSGSVGSFASPSSQTNTRPALNNDSNNLQEHSQSHQQPQRKLKRLACTCPNCRDGESGRNPGDKKKQHICHFPDCNKVYGKTSHLRAHLRWHSGERPYVCNWSFCGKKFTRSDELQRHRRTHTGEKRFQCPECLKRFMRSDHLSKHLKTHTSTKKANKREDQITATD